MGNKWLPGAGDFLVVNLIFLHYCYLDDRNTSHLYPAKAAYRMVWLSEVWEKLNVAPVAYSTEEAESIHSINRILHLGPQGP